jgi:hypothetical protein
MFYGVNAKTPAEQSLGKDVLEVLDKFYPGYAWTVFVGGGVLQIKNCSWSGKWGMVLKLKDIHHDAMVLKREIIMKAGEFLERAQARRGKRDMDHRIRSVEGIPQRQFGR